jgi:hypothetical protein
MSHCANVRTRLMLEKTAERVFETIIWLLFIRRFFEASGNLIDNCLQNHQTFYWKQKNHCRSWKKSSYKEAFEKAFLSVLNCITKRVFSNLLVFHQLWIIRCSQQEWEYDIRRSGPFRRCVCDWQENLRKKLGQYQDYFLKLMFIGFFCINFSSNH